MPDEKRKPSILITAIGTMAATTIALELRKASEPYKLIGADCNPAYEIVSSKDVDEFYQFPIAVENQEKYLKFVLYFCQKHNVRFLFAVIDEEIVNYSKNRELFEKIDVNLCIPNHDLIMTCHYKDVFSKWIWKTFPEIAIRSFGSLKEIGEKTFPVFVKPVVGRASNGCSIVKDFEELSVILNERSIEEASEILVQEYVQGEVVAVDIVRNAKTCQVTIVQRLELLRNKNGCGVAVEIIRDEILEKICMDLAESMNLNGVINAEFFRRGRDFKIIEINPRFSAGIGFSCLAGCEMVLDALKIAEGKECGISNVSIGAHYARRYEIYEL